MRAIAFSYNGARILGEREGFCSFACTEFVASDEQTKGAKLQSADSRGFLQRTRV